MFQDEGDIAIISGYPRGFELNILNISASKLDRLRKSYLVGTSLSSALMAKHKTHTH